MQIFLDGNILFSAAKSEGFVHCLLDLLIAEGHALCADAYVAEEAAAILRRRPPTGCRR